MSINIMWKREQESLRALEDKAGMGLCFRASRSKDDKYCLLRKYNSKSGLDGMRWRLGLHQKDKKIISIMPARLLSK